MKKVILATSCALILTACGGGGGGSSDSGNQQVVGTPLEQAKSLIETAKLFVSDADEVQSAYEGAANILSDEQSDHITDAISVASELLTAANEAGTDIDASDINSLDLSREYEDYYKVSTTNAKVVKINDNEYKLNGSVSITPVSLDWGNPQHASVPKEGSPFTVVYTNTNANLLNSQTGTSPKVGFSFGAMEIGTGEKQVKLSMGSEGMFANATLNKSETVTENTSYADLVASGVHITDALIKIDNAKLEANGNTVAVTTLSLEGKEFEIPLRTGSGTAFQVLPTKFTIKGLLKQATPKTDLTIDTTLAADETTVVEAINGIKDEEGFADDLQEIDGKFVKASWNMSIKGSVTKTNNVVIPVDFSANLVRAGSDQIDLKNLTASVEGKQIVVTGNFKEVEDVEYTTLNFTQGNASVSVDFTENADFETAPIMVSGDEQGILTKQSNGMFTAKFNDNTTITF